MTTDLVRPDRPDEVDKILEQVVIHGDLSKLTPSQRMIYYRAKCESVGLNPLSSPFTYLWLQGKLTLYCNSTATEQLRQMHGIHVYKLERDLVVEETEAYYEVTAYGRNGAGREDSDVGIVFLTGLRGQARADAKMKAVTKAKRRLTLSFVGLGMLDESEVEIPPTAVTATEIVTQSPQPGPLPEGMVGQAGGGPRDEATMLFPTPEADRAGLIQRARIAMARTNKQRVAKLKEAWFGEQGVELEKVDLAALVSFVRDLEEEKL